MRILRVLFFFFAYSLAADATCQVVVNERIYNILDFGVSCDSLAVNTVAINRAIEDAVKMVEEKL